MVYTLEWIARGVYKVIHAAPDAETAVKAAQKVAEDNAKRYNFAFNLTVADTESEYAHISGSFMSDSIRVQKFSVPLKTRDAVRQAIENQKGFFREV